MSPVGPSAVVIATVWQVPRPIDAIEQSRLDSHQSLHVPPVPLALEKQPRPGPHSGTRVKSGVQSSRKFVVPAAMHSNAPPPFVDQQVCAVATVVHIAGSVAASCPRAVDRYDCEENQGRATEEAHSPLSYVWDAASAMVIESGCREVRASQHSPAFRSAPKQATPGVSTSSRGLGWARL